MIDEKFLEKEIMNLRRKQNSPNSDYVTGYTSALSTVEGLIAIAQQQKVGEWIPCKQLLPEKRNRYYIVSVQSTISNLTYPRPALYDDYGFATKLDEEVIAWQPLPKPYTEEQNDKG